MLVVMAVAEHPMQLMLLMAQNCCRAHPSRQLRYADAQASEVDIHRLSLVPRVGTSSCWAFVLMGRRLGHDLDLGETNSAQRVLRSPKA